MPLRRSLLTVLCLAFFGTVPAAAQEKDPFAEWNRTNDQSSQKIRPVTRQGKPVAKTTRTTSEKGTEKASVTYFSGTQAESAAARSVPQISLREKTPTRLNVERMRGSDLTTPAPEPVVKPLSARTDEKNTSELTSGPIKRVAFNPDEPQQQRTTRIKNADFNPDAGPPAKQPIRSALVTSDPAAEGKSFEEFLNTSPGAPKNSDPGFDLGNDTEAEPAEPLFHRQGVGVASEATTRPATASGALPVNAEESGAGSSAMSAANSGPQSPGVTVQWVNHGGFNVGQECRVELVVKNTSQTVVRSVTTEAVIPANVEVVEARPAAVEGTELPTWTFGELRPGQSRSVMLKVIPKTRGDVRLDAYVRLTGTSSSQFSVQEPIIGVAVTGPEEIEVGQQVGYVVRVSNPGTGLANNVVIQAAIPEGLEHRNGSLLTIEIGTLNPGESRQARLSLTAVEGGKQQLAVRVLADGGLSDQTTTAISVAEPQLAIALAGPGEPMAGRPEDYTLTVSNSGAVQSTNVRAKYIIPDGCAFVSADRGGKFVEIDNAVEWFVGTLQPNDASNFAVTLKANETGEVIHKAGVMSERGQVTTCVLPANVIGTATLNLKIAADHRDLRVGEEIRWEVQVRNSGTREASNVGVSCELPAGFEFIDANGPTKYIAENGVLIFRSIPSIDVETDAKIVIRGRCIREGSQRLRLRVASDSINDVLIGEESASVSR